LEKVKDTGLAVLLAYECGIEVIDRIECFDKDKPVFWIRGVKHFDFQAITDSYTDTNTVLVKSYSSVFEQVLKLKEQANVAGAWQRKRSEA
jgi:hypothetical protein